MTSSRRLCHHQHASAHSDAARTPRTAAVAPLYSATAIRSFRCRPTSTVCRHSTVAPQAVDGRTRVVARRRQARSAASWVTHSRPQHIFTVVSRYYHKTLIYLRSLFLIKCTLQLWDMLSFLLSTTRRKKRSQYEFGKSATSCYLHVSG